MARPIIAIDIDDVLANNAAGFVEFSNRRYGTSLQADDYDERWDLLWLVDNEEVERRAVELHESGVLKTYTRNESAEPVLKRLAERFDLIIVTSRRSQVRDDTLGWMAAHYPGIFNDNNIYFAGIYDNIDEVSIHRTKADLVKELGASFLIDDQVKHCDAAARVGVKALLFGDYKWNRTGALHDNVVRVSDWAAVEDYFLHE